MPRHTPAAAVAMLIAIAAPLAAAEAQLPPSKYDRLQRSLEEKFAPKKTPQPKPSQSGGGQQQQDDFIYIEPGDKKKEPAEQKRSDASWGQKVYALIASKFVG